MRQPTPTGPVKTLLILGATGAVGQHVLTLALDDDRVGAVVAPSRRLLPSHPRLTNPVVDLVDFNGDESWLAADAVICALGTTRKIAGSAKGFVAIDRDLVVALARAAHGLGASRFVLNSSLGARRCGNLYLNTKAEAEEAIAAIGFRSFTSVRPSLIDADRAEARPGEQMLRMLLRLFNPLVPARYKAVKPQWIAETMLEAALAGAPGKHIIESERIRPPAASASAPSQ